jgi:pyrroloquinoline quinone biosynthesis protein D
MSLSPTQRPALKRGCRLSTTGTEPLLLIPEGVLRLQGPGKHILELCDGKRSLAGIVEQLQATFPSADPDKMQIDVATFLTALAAKGAVEFL